jgi:hypothetical protein
VDAGVEELRRELDVLADRAQHPSLELERFIDDYDEEDEPDQDELTRARRRRGAVLYAVNMLTEACLTDQVTLDWDLESGQLTDGSDPTDSFVWEAFPPRFRRAYDAGFFAKVLVTTIKVGYDLARPGAGMPSCVAEEIIIDAVCRTAEQVMDEAKIGRPWMALSEMLLEDTDFEVLFDADMDGIEHDPAAQRNLGMWVPDVTDWFAPFNPDRVVHPFVESTPTGPHAHDLGRLLTSDDLHAQAHDSTITDNPAHISGLNAASEAVSLARAAEQPHPDVAWVPDPSAPESSYARLLEFVSPPGSGWLTWEPHENADTVRTDGVIHFEPHRHFPVGDDQPWAAVAVTGVMMYVPLSVVVSYRPDPEVRERWERAFSNLFGDTE